MDSVDRKNPAEIKELKAAVAAAVTQVTVSKYAAAVKSARQAKTALKAAKTSAEIAVAKAALKAARRVIQVSVMKALKSAKKAHMSAQGFGRSVGCRKGSPHPRRSQADQGGVAPGVERGPCRAQGASCGPA